MVTITIRAVAFEPGIVFLFKSNYGNVVCLVLLPVIIASYKGWTESPCKGCE